jgi:hypothetical protein
MNADKHKTVTEAPRPNPFWVCFLVFLLLGCDYGFRLWNLWVQREQLNQAVLMQAQNAGALAQARQLEARLQAFSVELLQVAKTNAAAKQIVQDFNIQWNPGPAASAPAPTAAAAAEKK